MLLLFLHIHKILPLFSRESSSFNWSMNKPRKLQQRVYLRTPSSSLHGIHAAQIFWSATTTYGLIVISKVKLCLQKKMSKNFYPTQVKKNEHVHGVSSMVSSAGLQDLCLEYLSTGSGSLTTWLAASNLLRSEGNMQNSVNTGKIFPKLLKLVCLVGLDAL